MSTSKMSLKIRSNFGPYRWKNACKIYEKLCEASIICGGGWLLKYY